MIAATEAMSFEWQMNFALGIGPLNLMQKIH